METDLKIAKILNLLHEVAIATPKISGAKIAAAVVYKNKIISVGVNSYKSCPMQAKYARAKDLSIFQHAEIAAIKNSLRHLDLEQIRKSSLYICRAKNDVKTNKMVFGLSKPCSGCFRAIMEFGFKKAIYTLDSEGWELI
jgi:deoxycytidylate deaminase